MWTDWIKGIIKLAEFKRENPELFNEVINSPIPLKEFIEKDEKEYIKALENIIKSLKSKIQKYLPNPNEEYWNNKYPKINKFYIRHETDGVYYIDVRNFFQIYDAKIPTIKGKSDDEIALKSLQWVIDNIRYVSDKTEYGYPEYWAYPYQTLKRKHGDCEDGAILLANIMVKSGIPYWKVRITAGYVKYQNQLVGHAYVTYYVESKKKWVLLDWCFYPDRNTPVENREDYKDNKIYKDVWFSWSMKYCFGEGTKAKKQL